MAGSASGFLKKMGFSLKYDRDKGAICGFYMNDLQTFVFYKNFSAYFVNEKKILPGDEPIVGEGNIFSHRGKSLFGHDFDGSAGEGCRHWQKKFEVP